MKIKELKSMTPPSKEDRELAMQSYDALSEVLKTLDNKPAEIEIEETQEKILLPISALRLLSEILEATSKGKMVSIVPVATEMTTQAAADLLGCSRPHFVKLLETGKIPFTKVGKHRRVMLKDVLSYKKAAKAAQKQVIIEMMAADEELGLYDT